MSFVSPTIRRYPPGQDPKNPKKSLWSSFSWTRKAEWLVANEQAASFTVAVQMLKEHSKAYREYRAKHPKKAAA